MNHLRVRTLCTITILVCAPSQSQNAAGPSNPAEEDATPLRYLALGDSYTIGENVTETERWPVQLAKLLRDAGFHVAAPEIIARTGWTTDELDTAIDRAKPEGPYDLVTLLIGVNNQYRNRGIDEYRTQFAALLRRAIDFAGGEPGRVVVLSIPDWGVTPFGMRDRRGAQAIGEGIDRFNEVNRAESVRAGARYVDITPFSRTAASDATLVAEDGLHPSGRMYAGWAERALDAAKTALESSREPKSAR